MAAATGENKETKVGFQQFPETTVVIPDEKEMVERICLSLNLKDGQKSAGQSFLDPYTQAIRYIEEHRIVQVFQVTMATGFRVNSINVLYFFTVPSVPISKI